VSGARTFPGAVCFAVAAALSWACGEGAAPTGERELAGREKEHPDWSSPDEDGPSARATVQIDSRGVERSDGVWLFPADVSAATRLPPQTARTIAAEIDVARLGDDIAFASGGPENLRVRTTLEQILIHGDSVPAGLRARVSRYLLAFYVHHGGVPAIDVAGRGATGRLRADFIPGELASAVEIAAQDGAAFDIPKAPGLLGADRLQELEALLASIRPVVFGRPALADADGGVAAPAAEGGRSEGVTALIEKVRREAADRGLPMPPGGGRDTLFVFDTKETLCFVGLAAPEDGGAFRGLVGVPDPEAQKQLDAVLARAPSLDKIVRAVGGAKSVSEAAAPRSKVRAMVALYASGELGPLFEDGSPWRAIDGPVVRVGEQLWLLTNAAAAFDAGFGDALAARFSRDTATAHLRTSWRARTRLAVDALREAAGRGTDGTETRTPQWIENHLGRYAALMAAVRADLSALYLALEPSVRETGLVGGEEGARALLEDYVGWTFESYGFGAPPPDLQAEAEARRVVLRNLVDKGAVAVEGGDGAPFTCRVRDQAAVRTALAALLGEVRRIRFVGDAKAAALLADTLRAAEARWQRDAEARYRALERPRGVGFTFAPLFGEIGAGGAIERLEVGAEKGLVSGRIALLKRSQP
jgi:hypothetical protein